MSVTHPAVDDAKHEDSDLRTCKIIKLYGSPFLILRAGSLIGRCFFTIQNRHFRMTGASSTFGFSSEESSESVEIALKALSHSSTLPPGGSNMMLNSLTFPTVPNLNQTNLLEIKTRTLFDNTFEH